MSNADHKGSVEALTTMMEIIDKFNDKIPEGDYLVMMDSLKTVYGYVLNQNPDDDESEEEDEESEEEDLESEEEGWGEDGEAASCARYAAMAEGRSAGMEGEELSAMVGAAVAAAQRQHDALKAVSAAITLEEKTATALEKAREEAGAEGEGWTWEAQMEHEAAVDAVEAATRNYEAAEADREALAAQRAAMVAQRRRRRRRREQQGNATFICDECDHDLDWSLYVHFKESYDNRGEPYHPDDGGCPHRCINCHNDIVCERIIKFIDELN